MSGGGHGGKVGTGWKVRDSSGLVWPSMFPVRTDEMNLDRIGEASTVLRDVSKRVMERTEQIASSWARLGECYSSPEAPAVWALMSPAQVMAGQLGAHLRRAGDAIDDYVGELRGLRGQIDEVVEECEAFRAEAEGGVWRDAASTKEAGWRDYGKAALSWTWVDERKVLVPWDQDQDLIDRNEDLIDRYSQVVSKVTLAAGRCASTIAGLPTLRGFASELLTGTPVAPGWTPGQLVASWGPVPEEDRAYAERAGSMLWHKGDDLLTSVGSLLGHDPDTGAWRSGDTARTAWGGLLGGLLDQGGSTLLTITPGINLLTLPSTAGRLTGHPGWGGWAPQWFQDRGITMAESLAWVGAGDPSSDDLWHKWDDPSVSLTETGFNIATIALPLKSLKGARTTQAATDVHTPGTTNAHVPGGVWASRNAVRATNLGDLLHQVTNTLPTTGRTLPNTNRLTTVLTTLDRVPDNLPRPVSDDLFTNRPPAPDQAVRTPSTVHNPHPTAAPEHAPATATARTAHGATPPQHGLAPGRAADAVSTQPISGLPRASHVSPAHPGAPDSRGPRQPGGDEPGPGTPTAGGEPSNSRGDARDADGGSHISHDGPNNSQPRSGDTPGAEDDGAAHQDGPAQHRPGVDDGNGTVMEPVGGGEPLTQPTAQRGGTPHGAVESPGPDANADNIRAIRRQNEAADALARMGYDVEHQPTVLPTDRGVAPNKNPDYRIEGKIFDGYSPRQGTSAKSAYATIRDKVEDLQAPRILVNLDDSLLAVADLRQWLTDYHVPGLEEVLVVRGGTVQQIFP